MSNEVLLAIDAETDIEETYLFIAKNDSINNAEHLFTGMREKCDSLSQHPERGHCPPELERIGVFDYREIHFKPYRIIYQIVNRTVIIHAVLDGRRDLTDLLQKRLLR
jgi:toxin ParE1/3/4